MDSLKILLETQPIINIGCLGSVSDGKSTLIEKLTGIKTQKHSDEKKRNITIKQGYANMKIWIDEMENYTTNKSKTLVNHISFVDCPGHQELIKVMLSSIVLLDGAFIIIAVDQPLKTKPQLFQHLNAIRVGKVKKLIVCLNKIDLVSKTEVIKYKEEVDKLLLEYGIIPYVVIPTCFNKNIGINHLLDNIMKLFNPIDIIKNHEKNPIFRISRSFDINKPGTDWACIEGGVLGGSLFSGKLKVGDEIEIRPGVLKNKQSNTPLITKIVSIKTEMNNLDEIVPGGLFGIGTDIDPYYCKNDRIIGDVIGLKGQLPEVYYSINIKIDFIINIKLNKNDKIYLQIGTKFVEGIIKNYEYTIDLERPVCINNNDNIIICKKIDGILKIIGSSYI